MKINSLRGGTGFSRRRKLEYLYWIRIREEQYEWRCSQIWISIHRKMTWHWNSFVKQWVEKEAVQSEKTGFQNFWESTINHLHQPTRIEGQCWSWWSCMLDECNFLKNSFQVPKQPQIKYILNSLGVAFWQTKATASEGQMSLNISKKKNYTNSRNAWQWKVEGKVKCYT